MKNNREMCHELLLANVSSLDRFDILNQKKKSSNNNNINLATVTMVQLKMLVSKYLCFSAGVVYKDRL